MSSVHGIYFPTDYGADPTGLSESGHAIAMAIADASAAGGGKVRLDPGIYRCEPGLVNLNTPGITLGGTGRESTVIKPDDTIGNAGQPIITVSANDCRVADLTIRSTAQRTAGDSLLVLGGSNNSITASPTQRTINVIVENVDIENAFVGLHLDDTTAGTQLWGVLASNIRVLNTAAGGTGIWINTPNGGQHYMHDIYVYGANVSGASRALYGLRIQGANDIEIGYISTVYTQIGLQVDPPNGNNCNVIQIPFGDFDSTSTQPVVIAPQAGAHVRGMVLGGWASMGAYGSGNYTISVSGDVHNLTLLDGMWIVSGNNGIKVDGSSGAGDIRIGEVRIGAMTGTDFLATGGLQHFSFRGNVENWFGYGSGAIGIQVDSGCDHYRIDSDVSQATTPIVDNGGPHKLVNTW